MTLNNSPIEKPLARYAAGLVVTAFAAGLGWMLWPMTSGPFPIAILLLGVVITSWIAGFGPALVATFLGAALGYFLQVQDIGVEHPGSASSMEMTLYIAIGVGISLLVGNRRSALRSVGREATETDRISTRTDPRIENLQRDEHIQEDSERQYAALVEAVPQIVWTSTPTGEIDFANRRWYDASGFTPEQTMGTGWTAAVHPDDLPDTLQRWMHALETDEPVDVTWRLKMIDGSYRWQLARGVPIRDGNRVVKWFGTLTDIEDQKQAEEVLRETDRRKDEFLATLSHELRNPLAPIRNMLEVLKQDRDLDEATTRAIAVMDRQLRQMVRLIDDLLDVSRISQGRIELRPERVELATVIGQAVETSRSIAEGKNHQLSVTLPEQPVMLHGDPARLAQVFDNLLSNACKYTPPGGRISLHASLEGKALVVSVRDNGIGIAAEMLAPIFEMFTQADPLPQRPREGLGIGLTLVRRFVEMHHGSVAARSEGLGKGSEFLVRLPIVVTGDVMQPRLPPLRVPRPTGIRILVVDDNADAASSLAALLEGYGYEVRTAPSGEVAIGIAQAWRPRVLFCDLSMPGMHGNEVARHLRKELANDRTILVALTGYGSDADRQRTRDAGFDHHLVKPVDPKLLNDILTEAATTPASRG